MLDFTRRLALDSLLVAGEGVDQSHHHSTSFDGLSAEASWRLLARAAGQPLAITLSTEPIVGFEILEMAGPGVRNG